MRLYGELESIVYIAPLNGGLKSEIESEEMGVKAERTLPGLAIPATLPPLGPMVEYYEFNIFHY